MGVAFDPKTGNISITTGGGGSSITPDTEANLLASSPGSSGYVIATDTLRGLYYDAENTQWYELSLPLFEYGIDAGAEQSDANGYYTDTISEKYLYHTVLKWSDREEEGSLRIDETQDPTVLQIYLRGRWNTIDYGLSMNSTPELIHTPYEHEIDVRSGNSNQLSLSGLPVIQEYKTSAGAYQPPVILRGGTL